MGADASYVSYSVGIIEVMKVGTEDSLVLLFVYSCSHDILNYKLLLKIRLLMLE